MLTLSPKHLRNKILPYLLLSLATLRVYLPATQYDFVNYDDDLYVYENHTVTGGLTWDGVVAAFSKPVGANWHPLTLISHMLDCRLFGLDAGGHHFTSVVLHLANVLLIFSLLCRITGSSFNSLLVALLFAVHPLHVESVAWISERKDLLSTFFMLLALWRYADYVRRPNVQAYIGVSLWFVLGLLCKPMLVTLPLLLLLLDYRPFGRFRVTSDSDAGIPSLARRHNTVRTCLMEKLPLIVISAIMCYVTLQTQQLSGAIKQYPLAMRVANAVVASARYLAMTLWPNGLAIFYPHRGMPPAWQICVAGLALAGVTVATIRARVRLPWLVTGWAWYLITLAPVSGLIQIGHHSVADRYMYIPSIGVFLLLVQALQHVSHPLPRKMHIATYSLFFLLTISLAFVARNQVSHWQDSRTLFSHAIAVTRNNDLAHNNLGNYYHAVGQYDSALVHFSRAAEINPHFVLPRRNLGVTYKKLGDIQHAVPHLRSALALAPHDTDIHRLLGEALELQGRDSTAVFQYKEAIRCDSLSWQAHFALGQLLYGRGALDQAVAHLEVAAGLKSDAWSIHNHLGAAHISLGALDNAFPHLRRASVLSPTSWQPYNNLGIIHLQKDMPDRAAICFSMAIYLDRGNPSLYRNRAIARALAGDTAAATADRAQALRLSVLPPSHQEPEPLSATFRPPAAVQHIDKAHCSDSD